MKKRILPMEEIHEKYRSGTSVNELTELYGCSRYKIYKDLHQYCDQNGIILVTHNNLPELDKLIGEIYQLHQSGVPIKEIAERFHYPFNPVYKRLHKYCEENNLPFTNVPPKNSKPYLSSEKIYQLRQSGVPIKEIAQRLNCTSYAIYYRLHKYCKEKNIPFEKQISKPAEIKLPIVEVYEKYQNGSSLEDLAESYGCTPNTLKKKLLQFYKDNNLTWQRLTRSKTLILPMAEVYEMHQNGIPAKEIAEYFNCSFKTIYDKLHKYCEENHLPLKEQEWSGPRFQLPISKIYDMYQSGESMRKISEIYHCHYATISKKLRRYCRENNLSLVRSSKERKENYREALSTMENVSFCDKRLELYNQLKELLQIANEANLSSNTTIGAGIPRQKSISISKQN